MIRVYLDTCCFSRPLDDQSQLRVKLEAEAILQILAHVDRQEWTMIGSDAVKTELSAIRDPRHREHAESLAAGAMEHVQAGANVLRRVKALEGMGFGVYDSLHLAYAEAAGADVMLTTDDALVRRARRVQHQLGVLVANPLAWLKEWPK